MLAFGVVRCGGGGGDPAAPVTPVVPPVSITSVGIAPASSSLIVGESVKLALAVTTSDGANTTAFTPAWTSSAPAVATVSADGNVVAVASGSAIITVTVGGRSATANISVLGVSSVAIAPVSAALVEGDAVDAVATATFSNGSSGARAATWSSSAPAVASVSSTGRVTALSAGTANISATIGGTTGTAAVTVARRVASIALNVAVRTLNPNETLTLVPTIKFSDSTTATGKTVAWASRAPTVATVSQSGVVTAVGSGSADITATVEGRVATAVIVVRTPATTTLNTAAATTQSIGPNGGVLTTSAGGITYRLEVPAGALPTAVSIRMTPMTTVGNLPLSGGLVAAADLQPTGLQFAKAALLRMSVVAPARSGLVLAGFSMNDDGTKVTRELAASRSTEVVVSVSHFTGAGAAFGTLQDVASLQPGLARSNTAQGFVDAYTNLQLAAAPNTGPAMLAALLGWFDSGVLPMLQATTTDLALVQALAEYDQWSVTAIAVYGPPAFSLNDPALVSRRNQWLAAVAPKLQAAVQQNNQLCSAQQSLTAMLNVLFWQVQAQTLGVASGNLSRSSVLTSLCGQVRTISSNFTDPVQSGFPNDLDVVFGLQLGTGTTTPQPVTLTFSGDKPSVSFAKPSPANSNAQGAFTVAVTATGNTSFQVNVLACLTIAGATDVCGQQAFNRTSLDVSGSYTGRFSSIIRTPTGFNLPVDVPFNVRLTQNQNGVTGTYEVMQFNGPRGSVSATLVGQQLLNFTLNQFSPCSGVLSGTATFTIANRSIASTYTGTDCIGVHSNGRSSVAPGTTTIYDFVGGWTQGLHPTGFPISLWRVAQSGTDVFLSFSTYNATQQRMECRARFRGTVSPNSDVFSATLSEAIGTAGADFSGSARTSWTPDPIRQRGARINTNGAGAFNGLDAWFLTANIPPGCDP